MRRALEVAQDSVAPGLASRSTSQNLAMPEASTAITFRAPA